jgi:hypothetical protein
MFEAVEEGRRYGPTGSCYAVASQARLCDVGPTVWLPRRLVQEAKLLAAVDHPFIVSYAPFQFRSSVHPCSVVLAQQPTAL